MPRGSNSEVEQERVRRDEMGNTRPMGKRGAGAMNFEKKGFGSEKGMQTNAKSGMPADKKGI